MSEQKDPEYLLGATQREVERLQKQHVWIQTCLKGKIVFAPVNLQDPSLKVLDVGCADGKSVLEVNYSLSVAAPLIISQEPYCANSRPKSRPRRSSWVST